MNLRARFLGLITLSALTLFSCEEDISTIGLPPENNLGIFFADIPLGDYTSQLWIDNINTRGSGIMLAGSYQDPNFGIIEAKSYTEVLPSNTIYQNAQFDSAKIQLRVTSYYGNSVDGVNNTFDIYQLSDTIRTFVGGEPRKFTSASSEPLGNKIGELNFTIEKDSLDLEFADTNIDLNDSIDDDLDSAFYRNNFDSSDKYIYRNSSLLDDAFASPIFDQLKTNQYDSISEVASLFKGISIQPQNINGSIISYVLDGYSLITFYYHEDGEAKKSQYRLSSNIGYNNISPNAENGWNASEIDDLTDFYTSYTTNNGKAYLMSGTNVLLRVDLSKIRTAMLDTLPDAIVQSAEIHMSSPEAFGSLTPPENIRFWLTSTDSLANNNFSVASPPNIQNNNNVLAKYDENKGIYKVELPLFTQSLFSEGDYLYDQLIMSVVTSNGIIPQGTIRRLVLNKENIRFRYYYTVPSK